MADLFATLICMKKENKTEMSIERMRELMPEVTKGLSDKEVEEISFFTNRLVEMSFDSWMEDRKRGKEPSTQSEKDGNA